MSTPASTYEQRVAMANGLGVIGAFLNGIGFALLVVTDGWVRWVFLGVGLLVGLLRGYADATAKRLKPALTINATSTTGSIDHDLLRHQIDEALHRSEATRRYNGLDR